MEHGTAAASSLRLPPSTDWRNGSASDSSPEGYAFESRIGHWGLASSVGRADGTPTGNYARLQALAETLKHPEAVDAPSLSGAYPCPFRVRCPMSRMEAQCQQLTH